MSRKWFRESHRHSLAAKGIKTGRKVSLPRSKWPSKTFWVDLNRYDAYEFGTRLKLVEKEVPGKIGYGKGERPPEVSVTSHLTDEEYEQVRPLLAGVDEPRHIKTGRKNVQKQREKDGILDLAKFPELWEKVVKEIGTGRRYPDAFETWYKQWLKSGGFEKADEIILRMKEEEEVKTLEEGERRLRKMLFIQWQLEKGIKVGRKKLTRMFSRGLPQRAVRDVLARKLLEEEGIEDGYALATHMVQQGVKLGKEDKDELVVELMEQYRIGGFKLSKGQAGKIAEKWIRK